MGTEDKYPAHEGLQERYPAHEGLQVQEGTAPELFAGPKHYEYSAGLEVATPPTWSPPATPFSHIDEKAGLECVSLPPPVGNLKEERRWCGLSRRRFILVGAAVLLVVIIAVVAGAAGAALASRNNTPGSSAASAVTTTSSTTITTGSAPTSTGADPSTTADPDLAPTSAPSSSPTRLPPPGVTSSRSESPPSGTGAPRLFVAPASGILPLDCPAINGTQYRPPASPAPYIVLCRTDFDPRGGNVGQFLLATLNECIDSCTAAASKGCNAVTFGANITQFNVANCFLHKKAGNPVPTKVTPQAGALLLT